MLKLLCFTDAHIYDQQSCDQVLLYLDAAIERHKPDFVVCLGDLFDSGVLAAELGSGFRDRAHSMGPEWLFVYGNHDGSSTSQGRGDTGSGIFGATFGEPQQSLDRNGLRLITLADQVAEMDCRAFALEQAVPNTVLFSHGIFKQEFLDLAEATGVRLIVNGHRHFRHVQHGAKGRLEQHTLSPIRFGGRRREPGGYTLFEISEKSMRVLDVAVDPPPMPCNRKVLGLSVDNVSPWDIRAHFPNEPDTWLFVPPLSEGDRQWIGGVGRLQFRRRGEVIWDKSFGRASWDSCPSSLAEYNGTEYLIIGGTWVRIDGVEGYHSLFVVNPETGEEYYHVEVIGLSAPPVVSDGILYIVGQWREAIAVELATGKELWRHFSKVETAQTEDLFWEDDHIGGGWSVCSPAVGRYVWTVNARGDLFAYDRVSGKELLAYPAALPCNPHMICPYAPTLACAPDGYLTRESPQGDIIFEINNLVIEDTTLRVFM